MPRILCRLLAIVLLPVFVAVAHTAPIEDFDGAAPELADYPGEAGDPGAWSLSNPGEGGSAHALRLNGNLWLIQSIAPRALADSTVWSVAVSADVRGEVQAIGFGDGVHELFYTFAGRDLPADTNWWTVYQGSQSLAAWHDYLLPVGEDWRETFGELPVIDRVIYVNDADAGTVGVTRFDTLADVTDELPRAPRVDILYAVQSSAKVAGDLYRLSAQFRPRSSIRTPRRTSTAGTSATPRTAPNRSSCTSSWSRRPPTVRCGGDRLAASAAATPARWPSTPAATSCR
ncbi:MAG: hypothetical protein IPI34_06590 [bacterium]|nr:hypothetical protein [bacterium]